MGNAKDKTKDVIPRFVSVGGKASKDVAVAFLGLARS